MTIVLAACDAKPKQPAIDIAISYAGLPLTCQTRDNLKGWAVEQLQFFVSNIMVKGSEQQWRSVQLEDTQYQTKDVALISLICDDERITEHNLSLKLSEEIAYEDIFEISFDLGIPFKDNHQNPLTQASPLNVASMFWVWRSGHKFMRVEMKTDTNAWWFHLGSTGCSSASPVRAPAKACLNSNRFNYQLKTTSSRPVKINFSLDKLLGELALSEHTSCQSEPDNSSCKLLFNNVQQSFNAVDAVNR